MSTVIWIANVGIREDNKKILDGFLQHPKDSPRVRIFTEDHVRVNRLNPFELEVILGIQPADATDDMNRKLVKALAAVILSGLTRGQREVLEATVPELKLR